MKNIKIGMTVSVPDRLCYPGRRNPYEYENGVVVALSKDEVGVKIKVYRSGSKFTYEKWFQKEWLKKVSFSHRIGEQEEFENWLSGISELSTN